MNTSTTFRIHTLNAIPLFYNSYQQNKVVESKDSNNNIETSILKNAFLADSIPSFYLLVWNIKFPIGFLKILSFQNKSRHLNVNLFLFFNSIFLVQGDGVTGGITYFRRLLVWNCRCSQTVTSLLHRKYKNLFHRDDELRF